MARYLHSFYITGNKRNMWAEREKEKVRLKEEEAFLYFQDWLSKTQFKIEYFCGVTVLKSA